MKNTESKKLWLDLESNIPKKSIKLGPYTTAAYIDDPACLSFMTSRYKFCAKMLSGLDTVIEIGCGDGFGAPIVAQRVKKLICTDINKSMLDDNISRMNEFSNITYNYHNFTEKSYPENINGIYLVDVIEHIYPEEQNNLLINISQSLNKDGICIIGTPNKTSDKYASEYSKQGHVNLHDYKSLNGLGKKYFHNSFLFGMNDEVLHTGFPQMCHYLWILCIGPK